MVLDASAVVNALVDEGPRGEVARAMISDDPALVAPEHLRVEVFSAIRGRYLGGKVTATRSAQAVEDLAALVVTLVDTRGLLGRMWELRNQVSGYDAAYVAVAQAHECLLVTADMRLAQAAEGLCQVQGIG